MSPTRKGYVSLDHGHVHYREAGDGPCLVFLHQAAADSRAFEPVIDLLANGYRCVAIDLPGFGLSDYAAEALAVPGYAAVVVETLDTLNVESASIFGQHGGAAVATEIAAAHPARVERLVLSGSPLYSKEQGEANLAGFPRLVLKEDGSHLIDFYTYMATWTPPKDDAEAEAMTYELVGRLRPGPRNVEAYAAAFTYDLEGGLRRVSAPTLVLAGENAPGVKDVEPVCSFLTDARSAIVPNVGNWLETKPRVLADILRDFLEQRDDRRFVMPQWDDVMTDNDKRLMGMGFDMRKPTGFGENPALVVIDMNKGAVGEDSPVYEQFDRYPRTCGEYGWRALPYIQRLIAKARETKIPVVYSRHVFRATHGLPRHDDPEFAYSELSPQSEIVPEIAPEPGELMIEKTRASVFFSTPLLYVLMNKKVDTLIIVGNSTSGCVRATVVDASYYSPAFKVVLAEEAIFDRIELSHKAGLFDMQLKYADLKTTDEVITYLDQIQAIKAETATA